MSQRSWLLAMVLTGCGGTAELGVVEQALTATVYDAQQTPGSLCTDRDPNFDGYRYKERIAHCKRNVSNTTKDAVARAYGVLKADYSKYEFDHYLPLAIGGANDVANLWPQLRTEATEKDRVEQDVYDGMNNGSLTQAEAIAAIRGWHP